MLGPVRRIFRLFQVRPDPERELDEEIRAHLAMTEARLREEGWSAEAAGREARRRFGDLDAHRRAMVRIETGRWRMGQARRTVERISYTLRGAWRSLRRSPGFTVAVATTLGLGLGANAVMFGVVDRLLLSPPQHIVAPDQVRRIYMVRSVDLVDPTEEPVAGRYLSWPDFEDLASVPGLDAAAYTVPNELVMGSGEGAAPVQLASASPNLFPMLGTRPALGRFFHPEESGAGAAGVAVISHELWERAFGSDPTVLGRRVPIGPIEWEIVGVAPAGFTGAELRAVDVWVPIETLGFLRDGDGPFDNRNWWWLNVAARVPEGAGEVAALAQAASLALAGRDEAVRAGNFDPEMRFVGGPLTQGGGPAPSSQASVSRWLAGVSLIVLLIACANVANLLLARATRLRHELRIRVALGASRGRILLDAMGESFLFALLGGAAAAAIGFGGAPLIHRVLIPNVAFVDTGLGGRLLAFIAVTTVLTAGLAGLVPALKASSEAKPGGTRGSTHRRSHLQVGLLVVQSALTVVLLVGAGLFVQSLNRATALDLGFDPTHVVRASIEWDGAVPDAERLAVFAEAAELARALPGVEFAATAYLAPFAGSWSIGAPRVPGLDEYPDAEGGGPYLNKVSAGYFETIGLDIVRGGGFVDSDDDAAAPPVAVVGMQMASEVWPDSDPLGQCMYFGDDAPCTEVVGLVRDHRRQSLVEEVPHHLYYLNRSHPAIQALPNHLLVRTTPGGGAGNARQRLVDAVSPLSPYIRFVETSPLYSNVEPHVRSWRLGASMFTLFGVLALVVAAVGLYSILAFDVAQRRREMGVRAALGATRNEILAMVVRSALLLTSLGLVAGLVVAVGTARFLEPLLFEVSPRSPGAYAIVIGVLLTVGAAAALLPGWRATRVDPSEALRAE